MKLLRIFLNEGRKEDLKKKYSDKYDEKTLDWILNISDLTDFNHKYTDFVLKNVDPKTQDVEWWVEEMINLIKLFDKYQDQLEKKDINQYENYHQLDSAILPIQQREKEKELEKQVDKIYEDDKVLVVKPKTKQSSCKYGKGTRWCTAATDNNRFEAYTSGQQGLYYIILKNASKELGYKIAVHFANSDKMTFWDDEDNMMSNREMKILMTHNKSLFKSILDDYMSNRPSVFDKIVKDALDITKDNWGNIIQRIDSNPPFRVYLILSDLNHIPDMDNAANATLSIKVSYGRDTIDDAELIDKYDVFIMYKISNNELKLDISLYGEDGTFVEDLGLSGERFNFRIPYTESSTSLRHEIGKNIVNYVNVPLTRKGTLKNFLEKKSESGPKTWYFDKYSGYKFNENKGMIKDLVDWLDSGKNGTKLDFLTDIGKMERKIVNNRAVYARKNSDEYLPSSNWRGQLASFFSAAKRSGILNYRKMGREYLLTKGPNFEAFKEGKLKAI